MFYPQKVEFLYDRLFLTQIKSSAILFNNFIAMLLGYFPCLIPEENVLLFIPQMESCDLLKSHELSRTGAHSIKFISMNFQGLKPIPSDSCLH